MVPVLTTNSVLRTCLSPYLLVYLGRYYFSFWDIKLAPGAILTFSSFWSIIFQECMSYNAMVFLFVCFALLFCFAMKLAGSYFPDQGLNPCPPTLGAQSLNHWTTGEVQFAFSFIKMIFCLCIQWTWIWANSERQWRTEEPGMLQSMGSQRVGHDLVTERQQNVDEVVKERNLLLILETSAFPFCPHILGALNSPESLFGIYFVISLPIYHVRIGEQFSPFHTSVFVLSLQVYLFVSLFLSVSNTTYNLLHTYTN